MSPGEVQALELVWSKLTKPSHTLVLAILTSQKTLMNKANNHPNSYPKLVDAPRLASAELEDRIENAVHYYTPGISELESELSVLLAAIGDEFTTLQLNLAWPDPNIWRFVYNWQPQISRTILQVNQTAINAVYRN